LLGWRGRFCWSLCRRFRLFLRSFLWRGGFGSGVRSFRGRRRGFVGFRFRLLTCGRCLGVRSFRFCGLLRRGFSFRSGLRRRLKLFCGSNCFRVPRRSVQRIGSCVYFCRCGLSRCLTFPRCSTVSGACLGRFGRRQRGGEFVYGVLDRSHRPEIGRRLNSRANVVV
jgi:hypothetical protein